MALTTLARSRRRWWAVAARPAAKMPLDVIVAPSGLAAAAYGLRQMRSAYVGSAVNIRRSSDNATMDIGFRGAGDLDLQTLNTFVGGGSGFVAIWYDQSGKGNNAVQVTAANQPQLVPSVATLNGRPGLLYGDGGVRGLSVAAGASIDNMFANGGWWCFVSSLTVAAPVSPDRLASKGLNITDFFVLTGANYPHFVRAASTTAGAWESNTPFPVMSLGGHVLDISYSSASLANVPIITLDGGALSLGPPTQPVGTITSDAGNPLWIGNASTLVRGFNGHIAEAIFYSSIPTNPADIRTNQKAYWGTP